MTWWVWTLLGIALVIAEIATPGGFYLIFFGMGALVVGFLSLVGVIEQDWIELMTFSITSLVILILLRRPLLNWFHRMTAGKDVDSLIGETAMTLEDIEAGGFGKVELRGTAWNAHNMSTQAITRGRRCKVERVEGLSLWIRE